MCAGCPGGRAVSPATAYLNLNKMKLAVLAELRRHVVRGATITVLGDQWVLHSPTGGRQVFPDVETLASALVGKHDGSSFACTLTDTTQPGAQPLDARRFVQALLFGGSPE